MKKTWPELAPLVWAEGESGQAAFGTGGSGMLGMLVA